MKAFPRLLYGGTERVVSYLTEELVGHGHEVTLFASGDSQTKARWSRVAAAWRDPHCRETLPHHVRLMEVVFRDRDRFDIFISTVIFSTSQFSAYPCPNVTTLHGLVIRPT